MSNIAYAHFCVHSGNDPVEEVEIELKPVNFLFNQEYFEELLEVASEYPHKVELRHEVTYEIIYKQVHVHDSGGALIDRYWEIIHSQSQHW